MKKLRTILTMLLIAIVVGSSMAQTSQEYTVDEIAGFQTDLAAGKYDVYILTTSGGVYDLTSLVTITSDVVIKAAEDLAEKPVIMRTNSTGVGAGVLRTQIETVIIGLEGLIFDGTVDGTDKVVAFRAESTAHFSVNHCVFRNFTDINGVFRMQGAESSIDLRNSVFHDISQRLVHPWEVNVSYGHINIDNCLFYNIDGPVVWFRSTGGGTNLAIGTTFTVNNSTFHNINTGADGVFRGRSNATGETQIFNSVFTNIAEGRPVSNGFPSTMVDYCYIGDNLPQGSDNAVVTNLFTKVPVYEDADNFNFEITNADDFLVASGDIAGVVWYYPPRVNPDLLIENDTHVKVVFNRPVEITSAEITVNYELSGTFGLTGNPTSAQLVNEREVLLAVGDLTSISSGETIIVTVTGVADTYGMVLGNINNAAVYRQPIEIYVFTQNQTITNAQGQVALVQSSLADGYVYLVLENAPQQTKAELDAAVAAAKGAFAQVTGALTDIEISTFNLLPGTYLAYAVSTDGDLSDPSTNSIAVTHHIELPEMDIFLAFGQSNMAGRAPIEPSVSGTLNNIKLLAVGHNWVDASNPMNLYSTIRGAASMQRVGPSYSFAKAMTRHTGKVIGMVVNARGGTPIQDFSAGGPYYDANIARITQAKAFGTIKGIIWHQGESNNSDTEYLTRLNALATDYRAEIGEKVFFIAGQLGPWNSEGGSSPKYNSFNTRIPGILTAVDHADYVLNTGLTHIGDHTHFNLPSQILIGQRYAQKMLAVVYGIDISIIEIDLKGDGFMIIVGEEETITSVNDFSYTFETGSNVELTIEAGEGKLFTELVIDGAEITEVAGLSSYTHSFTATEDQIITISMETETEGSVGISFQNHLLRVYPNPATTSLHIDNPSDHRIESVKIFGAQGNIVYQDHSGKLEIDINSYPKGIYIISINNLTNLRFIKK